MKAKYKYGGCSHSKEKLVVFIEVSVGGSKRVRSIGIPWSELDDMNILAAIDSQIRKRLMAAWQEPADVAFDLPGLD
uniref:Uncharacterized protein n=1 Tax=uncultured prokaryote TaxID=198431 RepID=A0A0H5Q6D4_9ZZZZ|nr:hypothetical protein [uncultured prokaryote]